MYFPSKLIENAVNEISKLPGIGKKTALRLALHLYHEPPAITMALSDALVSMRTQTANCSKCFNISDAEICEICLSQKRNPAQLCIVENSRDVMAIESTSQYNGLYFVLGGVISPVDGIGPDDLNIAALLERVLDNQLNEIIMAINPTMEGDTTIYYLSKKIRSVSAENTLSISAIARGIPVGGELEYTDEITLGRSIMQRQMVEE